MKNLKIALLLLISLACSHQRFGLNGQDCPQNLKELRADDTCWLPTKLIKPTQAVVGYDDLKQRKMNINRHYSKGTLRKYLQKRYAPTVISPSGHAYILDRHHLSKGLSDVLIPENEKKVLIKIKENAGELSNQEFTSRMQQKNWVYLKKYAQPISFEELPQSLNEMEDDPYRTLAGLARDLGAFKKTETPFLEFYWADLYRQQIKLQSAMDANEWRLKTREAVQLSQHQKPIIP